MFSISIKLHNLSHYFGQCWREIGHCPKCCAGDTIGEQQRRTWPLFRSCKRSITRVNVCGQEYWSQIYCPGTMERKFGWNMAIVRGEGWGGEVQIGILGQGQEYKGDLHSSEFIYKIRPRMAFMVPQSAIPLWTLYGDSLWPVSSRKIQPPGPERG